MFCSYQQGALFVKQYTYKYSFMECTFLYEINISALPLCKHLASKFYILKKMWLSISASLNIVHIWLLCLTKWLITYIHYPHFPSRTKTTFFHIKIIYNMDKYNNWAYYCVGGECQQNNICIDRAFILEHRQAIQL